MSPIFSRRQFIEKLSYVGGMSLVMAGMESLGFGFASARAAPPPLTGGKGTKVVILGAGLAGLTAAYELTRAGYHVELLEARTFAGGRCQTSRSGFVSTDLMGTTQVCDFDRGLYLNHGPWRIPYHHTSTLHYTKAFAVPLEVFVNDNDASYVYFEKGKGPLAGTPIRKGKIAADMGGYTAELLAKSTGKGNLDGALTAEDHDAFIAYLVNEGRLSKNDLRYRGTPGRGFDVYPGAGLVPGPGKPSVPFALGDILDSNAWQVLTSVFEHEQQRTMFQPVGGMDQIAKGFERRVGHLIRYSANVDAIRQSPSGVTVHYTDKAGKAHEAMADYCICTIPLSVLRKIPIDAAKPWTEAMAKVAYAPVNKIGLQMKRRFWEEDHMIYGGHIYTDMPGIGSISLPSTGWQGNKGVVLGYYAFSAQAVAVSAKSPADREAFAIAAGNKVFPEYGANVETSFSYSWHLSKQNLGGWAEWSDEGRKTAYPLLNEPDGRIYLAGEHLTYLGGWQAGAIESAWAQIAKLDARVRGGVAA
jgi:monoamine oxidase